MNKLVIKSKFFLYLIILHLSNKSIQSKKTNKNPRHSLSLSLNLTQLIEDWQHDTHAVLSYISNPSVKLRLLIKCCKRLSLMVNQKNYDFIKYLLITS